MNKLFFCLITERAAIKYIVFIFFSLFADNFLQAQSQITTCNCPPNQTSLIAKKADTVFHLSNGKSIALCGHKDTIDGKVFYREFELAACGESQIIKFWGAIQLCQLRVIKDTLFVQEMEELPNGKNMQNRWNIWTIERIYFKNGKAIKDFNVNKNIPKYNKQQIQSSLDQYERAVKSTKNAAIIDNVNMKIADKLFIGAISGSEPARSYLKNFDKHFGGLDGEYLERYDDLIRKLQQWDTNKLSEDDR